MTAADIVMSKKYDISLRLMENTSHEVEDGPLVNDYWKSVEGFYISVIEV